MKIGWRPLWGQLFSMELRKVFVYRADFWINLTLSALGKLSIAYFMWKSVYALSARPEIGGRSFEKMMVYYLLAFFVDQMVRSSSMKSGLIAREIYDGSLTRYLLYPANVVEFKLVGVLVNAAVGGLQLLIGTGLFVALFGTLGFEGLSLGSVIRGLAILPLAAITFFFLALILEMSAFWADNVWSLSVILRFLSGFLGGLMLPLSLFPESIQSTLRLLPFYWMLGAPIDIMTGRLSADQWILGVGILTSWFLVIVGAARWVWRKGLLQFTGVGI